MSQQSHSGIGDNIRVLGDATFNIVQKYPTILADVINILGQKKLIEEHADQVSLRDFVVSSKIEYNNVIRYKEIIEELKIYQGKINIIYEEIDKQGSSIKIILLRNIRNFYLKSKGSFLKAATGKTEIDVIRENSDEILEQVEKHLLSEIERSNNIKAPLEVIQIGLSIVLVDAFIRCKILEEPI